MITVSVLYRPGTCTCQGKPKKWFITVTPIICWCNSSWINRTKWAWKQQSRHQPPCDQTSPATLTAHDSSKHSAASKGFPLETGAVFRDDWKNSSLWGSWGPSTGYSEKLGLSHPWECSKPGWAGWSSSGFTGHYVLEVPSRGLD